MNHVDKYASIPAEFREHVLRALNKPASKRTETEQKLVEISDEWLAADRKARSELEESALAMKAEIEGLTSKIEDVGREIKLSTRENQEFIREQLEDWAHQAREELAPTGWKYDEPRLTWERGDRRQFERPDLPAAELLESVVFTRRVIAEGDAENAVLRTLGIAVALVHNGHEHFLNDAVRFLNRQHSRSRRPKPRLGTRALQIAWQEGHRDTASIRDFLNSWGGTCKDDEWGGMSLDVADDFVGWELIDEGAKAGKDGNRTNKKVKDVSLSSMVSRFKKDRGLPR